MIARLATLYPAAKVTDVEAEQRLSLYTDLLQDIPFDILSRAFREAAKKFIFFPTVAEIRKIAGYEVAERRWRHSLLERMIRIHERDWTPPVKPEDMPTAEEMAEIRATHGIPDPKAVGSDKHISDREARRQASIDTAHKPT